MNTTDSKIEKGERGLKVMAVANIFLGLLLIAFVVYAYFTSYKPADGVSVVGKDYQALSKAYATAIFLLLPAIALTYLYSGVYLSAYLRRLRRFRKGDASASY